MAQACGLTMYELVLPSPGRRLAVLGVVAAFAVALSYGFPNLLSPWAFSGMCILACCSGLVTLWSP